MKKFQLQSKRDGQSAKAINSELFDTKQEAVNALHEHCFYIADRLDAIYRSSDDDNVRLTADGHIQYSDILANPTESDDGVRIDVYGYSVAEVEESEGEE